MADTYFPLRRKGASTASTAQSDYLIVTYSSLSKAQEDGLATGAGAQIKGTTYVLAQPLPAGAVGFPSAQGAANYLLQQTPKLASASWMSKYSGATWQRLVAGIGTVVALGAGGDDDTSGDDDDTSKSDTSKSDTSKSDTSKSDDTSGDSDNNDDSDSSSDAAKGAAVTAAAGLLDTIGLSGISGTNLAIRVAKVAIGGILVIVGLASFTGMTEKLPGVVKSAVKAAPLL